MMVKVTNIPVDTKGKASSWSKEHITNMQEADIACFRSTSDVKYYLQSIDDYSNVPKDIDDEERRKLPNNIIGDDTSVPTTFDGVVMAACPNVNTARECLNSGRFQVNHIYYPKNTQTSVELKTESLDAGDKEGKEEVVEDEIDVQIWADSVIQAAGDVMERKFWGGGW